MGLPCPSQKIGFAEAEMQVIITCNCLVQARTYAPTENRDLEGDFLSHSLTKSLDRSYITLMG